MTLKELIANHFEVPVEAVEKTNYSRYSYEIDSPHAKYQVCTLRDAVLIAKEYLHDLIDAYKSEERYKQLDELVANEKQVNMLNYIDEESARNWIREYYFDIFTEEYEPEEFIEMCVKNGIVEPEDVYGIDEEESLEKGKIIYKYDEFNENTLGRITELVNKWADHNINAWYSLEDFFEGNWGDYWKELTDISTIIDWDRYIDAKCTYLFNNDDVEGIAEIIAAGNKFEYIGYIEKGNIDEEYYAFNYDFEYYDPI